MCARPLPPVAPPAADAAARKAAAEQATRVPVLKTVNLAAVSAKDGEWPRGNGPIVVPVQIATSMASVVIQEASGDAVSGAQPSSMSRDAFDQGVQDLTLLLNGRTARTRILVMALELLSRYLDLPRVLALVADSERTELSVRAAVGEDADALRAEVTFPLHPRHSRGDMFTSTYYRAKDVVVEDAFAPSARCLIPQHYFEAIGSRSFVLLSCAISGHTWVLLLADRDSQHLPAPALLSTLSQCRALIVRAAR